MRLSDYLRTRGLTRHEFALSAKVAHTTIGRLLAGERIPNARTRRLIVVATDGQVTERDLLLEGARMAEVSSDAPVAA